MTDIVSGIFSGIATMQASDTRPAAPDLTVSRRVRRICFMVNHSAAGGVGELWSDLAQTFAERGFGTGLAALWPLPEAPRATLGPVPWHHVAGEKPRSPASFVAILRKLVHYLGSTQPDCIVTAMPAANLLVPIAAGLTGRHMRVITTHHTPADTLVGLFGRLDRYAGALPNIHASVSVSRTVAASYARPGSWLSRKQRIIYNALPPRIESQLSALALERARSYRRGGKFHVVALGRLSGQKNYDVLIRAAMHLDDVVFSIVGGGPDEARLRALAETAGVRDKIRFCGFMAREAALTTAAHADAFVQMSRFEGHSLALIEAARLGLPLVLSDIPVQREGVTAANGETCGVLVAGDDDRALAESIRRLSREPEHYAAMAAASIHIGQECSFDRMIDSYERLMD